MERKKKVNKLTTSNFNQRKLCVAHFEWTHEGLIVVKVVRLGSAVIRLNASSQWAKAIK